MLIVGQGALARPDGAAILASRAASPRRAAWSARLERLQRAAHGRRRASAASTSASCPATGGRDVAGILEGAASGEIEVVFLLGADEIDTGRLGQRLRRLPGPSRRRRRAAADVILPGAAYTEKNATYVNTEGRRAAGEARGFPAGRRERGLEDPPGALRGRSASSCRYDTLAAACAAACREAHPHFGRDRPRSSPAAWGDRSAGRGRDRQGALRARRSQTST